jgi:hypothetical protein
LFIDLLKDCEVRAGFKTDAWIKVLCAGKVREQQVRNSFEKLISNLRIIFQEDLALSILHSRGRKSLDLLANDIETRENWVTGLKLLIRDSVGKPYTKITDRYVNSLG